VISYWNSVALGIVLSISIAGTSAERVCKPQFAPLETGSSSGASEPDSWRKEQARDWGGTGWLGWTRESETLQPVRLVVRDRPKASSDDVDEVYVESHPDVVFAVRCVAGLRAGRIRSAGVTNRELSDRGPLDISLGTLQYQLRVESNDSSLADAKVVLDHAGRTQVLYSADGYADDPHFQIVWAGDLDRDGKLDLVVNLHRKYSWHPYRLLLSTKASATHLVGEAAVFETGD